MNPFDSLIDQLDTGAPAGYDDVTGPEEFIASWGGQIEGSFGRAGFYRRDADPYPAPTKPVDAPPAKSPPTVTALRRMWIARFNPNSPDFRADDGSSGSDPADNRLFPWLHPEAAGQVGWWLSTVSTPANRTAIEDIALDDLVVIQRTERNGDLTSDPIAPRSMIGVAAVTGDRTWSNETGVRERAVCLAPLTLFTHPVPVSTAQGRRYGRLKGRRSISKMPQLHGQRSQVGFTLSAVDWDDVPEVCSVCNLHPKVFTDPLPVVASRLAATVTGNRDLWRYRWDHVFRNDVRREHERRAVAAARKWAGVHDLVEVAGLSDFQAKGGAGFDVRFFDAAGGAVEVEIKGYSTNDLAAVHLQPSQVARARVAASTNPRSWFLYVLLEADTHTPTPVVLDAAATVAMIDAGELDRHGHHQPA